jgi:hypothetical protein
MDELHSVRAFVREEPRVALIDALLRSLLEVVELESEGRPVEVDGFRLRDPEHWRTVRENSLLQNLGSLSTACNCTCTFCYEDGNPDGLFEKEPRFVSLEEARARLHHLHDGWGLFRESKGFFEPLVNPHFLELLELVREHEPDSVIDVTTNGALLSREMVASLARLAPLIVNVSLVSAQEPIRHRLMGDHRAGTAIRAIDLLRTAEIPVMGTVVPLPEQGWDDIAETICFLDANDVRLVRMSMPGLTGRHPRYRPGALEAWLPELVERTLKLRAELRTPVIISPFAYVSTSIAPIVDGIVQRSPAAEAGVRVGDTIARVDGKTVVSRSHAASLLKRASRSGATTLEMVRDGRAFQVHLTEPAVADDAFPYKPRGWRTLDFPGQTFGLCLPGSFHLQYLRQIHEAITKRGARRALVVASPFFHELVEDLTARLPLPEGVRVELVVPRNEFYGGTVSIGDLWVLDDIERAVRPHLDEPEPPDLLILPSSFLSRWGRDLRGVPYPELEARLGIDIAFVQCERIVL